MAKQIETHVYNNKNKHYGEEIINQWWNCPKPEEMHIHAWATFQNIKKHQEVRHSNNLKFAKLYMNRNLENFFGRYSRLHDTNLQNYISFNLIKACIDTVTAKIAKNKTRPVFLTEGGNYDLKERAKDLTQFMQGLFQTMGTGFGPDRSLYSVGTRVFGDGALFGTGAARFFPDEEEKTVKVERHIIDEIYVDEIEGMYGTARQMFRSRFVSREVLKEMFPSQADKISAAGNALDGVENTQTVADMVMVLEGWHLKSGPNARDGRYIICIENATLGQPVDYDRKYFPYNTFRWCLQPLGWYGTGLCEELIGLQLEINKVLRVIQMAQHLFAVPQVWVNQQSKAILKHINNEIGGIKFYEGNPPVFITPQAMSQEMYQHLDRLWNKGFETTGISQLSAASKKPAGLDAAVALREYQDIESERFSTVSQAYEDWYIDSTYMVLDELREMRKRGIDPIVRVKDGDVMKVLRFSKVDIPDDKITVRAYGTNMLPSQPAAKLQKVQELVQGGFYTQEEALDLLDYPDIKRANDMKMSPKKYIVKSVEHMIRTGEYVTPEPFFHIETALSVAQSYYAMGKIDDMPEEKLNLLRRFMTDLNQMANPEPQATPTGGVDHPMAQAAPDDPMLDPMMQDPMMQGDPTAVPEAPPTSPLIPTM